MLGNRTASYLPAKIDRSPRGRTLRDRAARDDMDRRGIRPSARELFPYLRERLLASRPVLPEEVRTVPASKFDRRLAAAGRKHKTRQLRTPWFGAPTFRNVIENGRHV